MSGPTEFRVTLLEEKERALSKRVRRIEAILTLAMSTGITAITLALAYILWRSAQ